MCCLPLNSISVLTLIKIPHRLRIPSVNLYVELFLCQCLTHLMWVISVEKFDSVELPGCLQCRWTDLFYHQTERGTETSRVKKRQSNRKNKCSKAGFLTQMNHYNIKGDINEWIRHCLLCHWHWNRSFSWTPMSYVMLHELAQSPVFFYLFPASQ